MTASLPKSLIARFATILTTATFIGVGLTGLAMTLHIGGHALNTLHTVTGVAFCVAAVLHLARNWRAMVKLLSRRSSQIVLGVGAVALVLAIVLAPTPTRRGPPPANTAALSQVDGER